MAPRRNQMPPWHEHVVLGNGRELLLRPIRPADAGPLRAAFSLLTPEEICQRFLQPMTEMPEEVANRLANPDPRSEFALVAAEPLAPGEALIGAVARLTIVPGTRQAEFRILVSRYVAGLGLGRRMLGRLVRWARAKRLHHLHGDVHADNAPMLALAHSLGFTTTASETPGLVRVSLQLNHRR